MSPKRPHKYGLAGQVIATVVCATIWGGLFTILGMLGNQERLGAICGVAVGSVVGFGYARGQIGPVVPWMSAFAFLGAILGPACDADPLPSALWGAAIGGFIGAAGIRGLLALIGCLIGVNVGAQAGDAGGWLGLVAGAIIGWWVGHLLILLGCESDASL